MGVISVSLPADGTSADVADVNTPITTIVNEFNGNIDNANIKTGAAIATSKLADDAGITGAKLATNAVAAANLATNAITLGYAAITGNFSTTSATAVQITGLTSTVTIPSGGRKVKITVFSSSSSTSGAFVNVVTIWDGTVGSGTQLAQANQGSSTGVINIQAICIAVVTPSAGSKTYNVGFSTTGGTGAFGASSTQPAFILVEVI